MARNRLTIPQGGSLTRTLTLRQSDGTAVTTYAGSETLTLQIWRGDDQAAVDSSNSTVTWKSAANGKITLTLSATDTANYTPGLYRILLSINNEKQEIGTIRITPAPGAATALRQYVSFDEMLRFAPGWILSLIEEQDQTDLAEVRHEAAVMLDDLIVDRYSGRYRAEGREVYLSKRSTLRTHLDNSKLMTSGTRGRRIREIVARWAIALQAESQISGGENDNAYQRVATKNRQIAEGLLKGLICEIDTDGDGTADIVVPFLSTAILR